MKYTVAELGLMTNSQVIGNNNETVEQLIFDSRLIFSAKTMHL